MVNNSRLLNALLRPVVRFCLRQGVSFQLVADTTRDLFLDEAAQTIRDSGEEPNPSRLSAMTGISRRQAADSGRRKRASSVPTATLISRVIGQWLADPSYSQRGRPNALTFEGTDSAFHALVAAVSRDLNAYTVLKELERSGSVERTKNGLQLIAPVLISDSNAAEGFRLLGDDVEELVQTVEENVVSRKAVPNLHLRTEYTRVSAEHAAKVKQWLIEQGSEFHSKARKFLAALDLDITAQRTGDPAHPEKTVRVVLGSFGRVIEAQQLNKKKGTRNRAK